MKTKKSTAILLALVLVFALGACAKTEAPVSVSDVSSEPVSVSSEPEPEPESSAEEAHPFADDPYYYLVEKYDIDLLSAENLPMTDERAPVETLIDVFYNWYQPMQSKEQAQLVYEDFAEAVGCDASTYKLFKEERRIFAWYDKETGKDYMSIQFELDEDGTWRCTSHQAQFPSDLTP